MLVSEILEKINDAHGNDKLLVLAQHKDNELLKKVLEYTYNHYKQYHVIKVPETTSRNVCNFERAAWSSFFTLLDECDKQKLSGNAALNAFSSLFSEIDEQNELWMRKVLLRHLNIGLNISRIKKVFDNLIEEFKVQLAHKFEEKRVKNLKLVAVEPKLDGFRCIAVLKDDCCVLYSRNGKVISQNYEKTICKELAHLLKNKKIQPCVLDGELMGKDFKSTSEQVHKKEGADTSDHYYHVFGFLSLEDWIKQESSLNCQEEREKLEDLCLPNFCKYVKIVPREIVHPNTIKHRHDMYVSEGFEGVMIKILEDKYKFGRGHNVMKLKQFLDADLPCIGFKEGTGKYSNMLGAIVVDHNGVLVDVGSGFSDEQRKEIWENRNNYRGMIAEIRYQEETEDGSLRFNTFRCWRHDKDNKLLRCVV